MIYRVKNTFTYMLITTIRSIFIGMPLIMFIYVLTAVSYVAVLPVASYDWGNSGQTAAVSIMMKYIL